MTTANCPECHGDGYQLVGSGVRDEYGEEYPVQERCLTCDGEGEIQERSKGLFELAGVVTRIEKRETK